MMFDWVIDDESDREISQIKIRIFLQIEPEETPWNGWTDSTRCGIVYVSCRVDSSTLRVDIDKPSWGPTNW